MQGSDGNFYGTTYQGGSISSLKPNGLGTVFQITPSGTLATLYSFCPGLYLDCGTDGANPQAGLVQGSDGNFYGTTSGGGANSGGTVFKITPSGTLTTLYSFCSVSNCADGATPSAGLIQGSDGNFYGTTEFGGGSGGTTIGGTVFRITPSSTLTVLYSFCSQSGCTDGENPEAGLVQASMYDGYFYGTTSHGGAYGGGTVFQLKVFPLAEPSTGSLAFGNQIVNTTSASQTVTLSNIGGDWLNIASITASGDFSETNNCGTSVAVSGSCTINVTFSPTATGTLNGTLTITDNSHGVAGSTQSVSLTGTGTAPTTGVSPPP